MGVGVCVCGWVGGSLLLLLFFFSWVVLLGV